MEPGSAHTGPPRDAVAVVRGFYEAMHAFDVDRLLGSLADDFVARVSEGLPGDFGGTYEGGATMLRECWVPVHRRFGVLPHPTDVFGAGTDRVVAVGEYRGTVPSTGRELVAAFAHLFRVGADGITELRQITDTALWEQATRP